MRFQLVGPRPQRNPIENIRDERKLGASDLQRIKSDAHAACHRLDGLLEAARVRERVGSWNPDRAYSSEDMATLAYAQCVTGRRVAPSPFAPRAQDGAHRSNADLLADLYAAHNRGNARAEGLEIEHSHHLGSRVLSVR